MRTPHSLALDNPAWPLLETHISYWGPSSAIGAATGLTIVCADLVNHADYQGLEVKILSGPAAGQKKTIALATIGGTITVPSAFTNNLGAVVQIAAGTRFVILSVGGAGGGGGGVAPIVPEISLFKMGICDAGMVASTTAIVCTHLAGLRDDSYNNEFWMQVVHNTSAPGTAPEREIRRITDYAGATGTFTTDAFSVNVEANDIVVIFHESLMGAEILGYGTLTFSSTIVPADAARTEGNDYFKGAFLVPTEGACRFQPRKIVSYTGAGGVFTIDSEQRFTAGPGTVDYIIISGDPTMLIPGLDSILNQTGAHVVGNKTDTAITTPDAVSSLVRYAKANLNATGATYKGTITNWVNATQFDATGLAGFGDQAFVNGQYFILAFRDAGGAAALPQGEFRLLQTYVSATGTFTHEAFSVALATGDIVVILHQSQLFPGAVPGYGVFDTSSTTAPADSTRAARYPWEVADHHKGLLLMPIMGDCRFIARRIVGFTLAGGIFILDPNNPFPALPGNSEYLILNDQTEFVPAADGTANRTPSDVIGNKGDTAQYDAASATASAMRFLKGLMATDIVGFGTFTTSSTTVPADNTRPEGAAYFKGCLLMPTAGVCVGQPRKIVLFTNITGVFTLDSEQPFTAAPGLVTYVILKGDPSILNPVADNTGTQTMAHTLGVKADTKVDSIGDIFNSSQSTAYTVMRRLKKVEVVADMLKRPLPRLLELWEGESALPNAAEWDWLNPLTGTPWTVGTITEYRRCYAVPALSETARLWGRRTWLCNPSTHILRGRFIIQFSMRLTNVANILNAGAGGFFVGVAGLQAAHSLSNDIVGFRLNADALELVSDAGGVETTSAAGAGTILTNVNNFTIDFRYDNQSAYFYVGDNYLASLGGAPRIPVYPVFYIPTEAGGAATLEIMGIRMWREDRTV